MHPGFNHASHHLCNHRQASAGQGEPFLTWPCVKGEGAASLRRLDAKVNGLLHLYADAIEHSFDHWKKVEHRARRFVRIEQEPRPIANFVCAHAQNPILQKRQLRFQNTNNTSQHESGALPSPGTAGP